MKTRHIYDKFHAPFGFILVAIQSYPKAMRFNNENRKFKPEYYKLNKMSHNFGN